MLEFEKLFLKLYPKSESSRIKMMGDIKFHIERLEKSSIIDPENVEIKMEIEKWNIILDSLKKKLPIEEIDKMVLGDVFNKIKQNKINEIPIT